MWSTYPSADVKFAQQGPTQLGPIEGLSKSAQSTENDELYHTGCSRKEYSSDFDR